VRWFVLTEEINRRSEIAVGRDKDGVIAPVQNDVPDHLHRNVDISLFLLVCADELITNRYRLLHELAEKHGKLWVEPVRSKETIESFLLPFVFRDGRELVDFHKLLVGSEEL
jgi:hypothetical protein